ncbi:polymer-forming cytoskeletal protein [Natronomonas gomsonensis]|uniref:type IV pilin n=1 Tax=Natronomonas gomsonensis TaxID=1046043 RepID=UPI0015BD5078
MNRGQTDERGLSPVIGVVLLVGIVVALVAVSAVLFLGLTEERDPAPEVSLSLETDDGPAQYALRHGTGDALDGEKVELRGAADPTTLKGRELTAGETESVYPVEESIEVVWFGDNGASYVLKEFEVNPDDTVPGPEKGCEWVDDESDCGTESVKVETVVNCDVETVETIQVQDGGVVIGATVSGGKDVDADNAEFYGDVDAEKVFNLQDGNVTGSVESETADVKLGDAFVDGDVTAEKVVELQSDTTVEGDAVSETKDVKVQDGSTLQGDAVSESGQVKLEDATVDGHVYVDDSDFDCTNSTINGQDCDDYTPKDPDDY